MKEVSIFILILGMGRLRRKEGKVIHQARNQTLT